MWYVFPTHVGVNRSLDAEAEADRGLPHARGGEPNFADAGEVDDLSAFLTWIAVHRAELVERNDRMLGREGFSWTALPWFEFR